MIPSVTNGAGPHYLSYTMHIQRIEGSAICYITSSTIDVQVNLPIFGFRLGVTFW